MIPDAFYTVLYKYDRDSKRWAGQFTSTELDGIQVIYPILDGRMEILGKDVVCEVEEDLALAFMQQVDVIKAHRTAMAQAATESRPQSLDVPEPESPAE